MAESILKLRVDSNEYESKIKRASQGLLQMEQACRRVGGTLAVLDDDQKNFVASLGKMETSAKTTRGKIRELTAAFIEQSMQFKRLSDEEKNGDFGKNLIKSLDEIKIRIKDEKKNLADVKKELSDIDKELNGATQATGDFSGVLGQLGSKLGINADLMGLVTTGTIGMTAAVGAGAAAAAAAAKTWAEYNAELAKQQQITTVTTGLKGDDADKMTSAARALAKTYDVDFRDAINAANVLMTQFGKTGDQAIQLLREGMQGMIQGDGPKMLNMIQQFAPAFRDAGISADQLVAVIHNSEGGLFSEQNMSAILMGIKNIRNMTDQTAKDLAQMGINGEEMSRQMSDGTMTVFEALQKVAEALETANSGSKEAGRVMQDVFGRQGAMQGMKLGRAIAELNTNLEQTKIQTGEVGEAFDQLYEANNRLEQALQKTFGYNGWEEMSKSLETEFINTLTFTVDAIDNVKNALDSVYSAIEKVGDSNGFTRFLVKVAEVVGPLGNVYGLLRAIGVIEKEQGDVSGIFDKFRQKYLQKGTYKETYDDKGNLIKAVSNGKDVTEEVLKAIRDAANNSNNGNGGGGGNNNKSRTPKVDTDKEITIQQQIAALEKEAFTASEERRKEIAATIQELDKELARQQQIRDALHGTVKDSKELQEAEKQYADAVAKVASWQTANQKGIGNYISDLQSQLSTQTYGTSSYNSLASNIIDATTFKNLMQTAIQNGLNDIVVEAAPLWQQIINADDIPNEKWQEIIDKINAYMADHPIELDFTTGSVKTKGKTTDTKQKETSITKEVGQIASGIGQVVNGIDSLGVEIPEGLKNVINGVQTVTSILGGIATTVLAIEALAAADTLIPFALGGVVKAAGGYKVPGNRMSGDQVPALLNSGETVLTRAQAGVIDTLLSDAGRSSGEAQPYVTGEKIWLGVNNFLRRSGRGEIVTSRR